MFEKRLLMQFFNQCCRMKKFWLAIIVLTVVCINYDLNFGEIVHKLKTNTTIKTPFDYPEALQTVDGYQTAETTTIEATSFEYLKALQLSKEKPSVCHFPDLDPWHPSLAEFLINGTANESCPQMQPNLTSVDMQGFLFLNQSALDIFINELKENGTFVNIHCFYWTFDRGSGSDDNEVAYSPERVLNNETSPVALDQDMVKVICYKNESKNDSIYFNLHAHPANKSHRKFASPTDTKLSVLMLGIDSISNSEFRRRMNLTLDYVVNKMGMHMFNKMNKIGEDSYSNLIAMLTGQRAYTSQAGMPQEFYYSARFDSAPLIWRYFADKGYATVFNEDWAHISIFHYYPDAMLGFYEKPVDYYYHMFWLVYGYGEKSACIGDRPPIDAHLDIIRRHTIVMHDMLQFSFNFFTDCGHDVDDDTNKCDWDYTNFFQETFEGGYLNKTVVIFFSDHGSRHNNIRKTFIGSLEEQNPFFGLWLPEWFYKQHPHLKKALQRNVDKYVSTFDVHETLKDILNEDFATAEQSPEAKRGLSLLRNLPKQRFCNEAGVPDQYCLCKKEESVEINSPLVNDAASFTVTLLNKLLEPLFMKCHEIKLLSVLSAASINFDQLNDHLILLTEPDNALFEALLSKRIQLNDHLNKIRLILLTEPNNALFEALLSKRMKKESNKTEWALVGEIERISQYGKSADCIKDRRMKKFCTCIKI